MTRSVIVGKKYTVRRVGFPTVQAKLIAIVVPLDENSPDEGLYPVMLLFEKAGTPYQWYWMGYALLGKAEVQQLRQAYRKGKAGLPALQEVLASHEVFVTRHWRLSSHH
ncbi:MAG TPA: hypothetical protein ENJ54_00175 [Chloroflexi bacterium]|nr:hypothetical protein [Chloroflexota bacterium]